MYDYLEYSLITVYLTQGDVVAIWGAGPIGQMCADFSFINGASRVIIIDTNWRLDYVSRTTLCRSQSMRERLLV